MLTRVSVSVDWRGGVRGWPFVLVLGCAVAGCAVPFRGGRDGMTHERAEDPPFMSLGSIVDQVGNRFLKEKPRISGIGYSILRECVTTAIADSCLPL